MKSAKFLSIFIIVLILITLMAVALWCVILPEDAKEAIEMFRWPRSSEHREPLAWMDQAIETNSNKSLARLGANVLMIGLGELEISAPENVMTYITFESPCKTLKPQIKRFERYRNILPDNKLYVRLFKAIEKFHSMYCGRDERYRKLFSQWQEELLGLHEQFVDCEGAPDWYENSNTTILCSDARNIMNCYAESIKVEIGIDAAKAWKYLFRSVLNEAMIKRCKFPVMKQDLAFNVESISAESFSSLGLIFISLSVLFIL